MSNTASVSTIPTPPSVQKLAYSAKEASEALGVSTTTLWRLEKRGLIRAVPGMRVKLYGVDELRRFVGGKSA